MAVDIPIKCVDTWNLNEERWTCLGNVSSSNGVLSLDASARTCHIRPAKLTQLWKQVNAYYDYLASFKFDLHLQDGAEFEIGLNNGVNQGPTRHMAVRLSLTSSNGLITLDSSSKPYGSFNGTTSFSSSSVVEVRVSLANGSYYARQSSTVLRVCLSVSGTAYDSGWISASDMTNAAITQSHFWHQYASFDWVPVFSLHKGKATLGTITGFSPVSQSEAESFLASGNVSTVKCSDVVPTIEYIGANHIAKVTMSCATAGAMIQYSVDSGALGDHPFYDVDYQSYLEPLFFNKSVVIRAIAALPDAENSEVLTFAVQLDNSLLPRPEITPFSDFIQSSSDNSSFMSGVDAKPYLDDASSIARYTLDGSEPSVSSNVLDKHLWVKNPGSAGTVLLTTAAFKGNVMSAVNYKRYSFSPNTLSGLTSSTKWNSQANAVFNASSIIVNDSGSLGIFLRPEACVTKGYSIKFTVDNDFIFGSPKSKVDIRSQGGQIGFWNNNTNAFVDNEYYSVSYPITVTICQIPGGQTVMLSSGQTFGKYTWGYYDSETKSASSSFVCFCGDSSKTSFTLTNITVVEGYIGQVYDISNDVPTPSIPSGYYTSSVSPTLNSGSASVVDKYGNYMYNGYIPLQFSAPTFAILQNNTSNANPSAKGFAKYFIHPDSRAWATDSNCLLDFERENDTSVWSKITGYSTRETKSSVSVAYGYYYQVPAPVDDGRMEMKWHYDLFRYAGAGELAGASNIWYVGKISAIDYTDDLVIGLGFDIQDSVWTGVIRKASSKAQAGWTPASMRSAMFDVGSFTKSFDTFTKTGKKTRSLSNLAWAAGRKGPKNATQTRLQLIDPLDHSVVYDSGWSDPVSLQHEAMPAVIIKTRKMLTHNGYSSVTVSSMFGFKNLTNAEMDSLFLNRSLSAMPAPMIDTQGLSSSLAYSTNVSVSAVGTKLYSSTQIGTLPSDNSYWFNDTSWSIQQSDGDLISDADTSLQTTLNVYEPFKIKAISIKNVDDNFKNLGVYARSSEVSFDQQLNASSIVDVVAIRPGLVVFTPKQMSVFTDYRSFKVRCDDGTSFVLKPNGAPVFKKVKPGSRSFSISTIDFGSNTYNSIRAFEGAGSFYVFSIDVPYQGSLSVQSPSSVVVNNQFNVSFTLSNSVSVRSVECDGLVSWSQTGAVLSLPRVGVFKLKVTADVDGVDLVETVYIASKAGSSLPSNLKPQTPEQFT
jgi:hypothetical protein